MHSRLIFSLIVLMLVTLSVSMTPTNAWVYPDSTSDAKWEQFGPRAERLLINLYATVDAEFDALEAGDIDIIDWPIPKTRYIKWTTQEPYASEIKVVSYGPEFGLVILDMNSNNNQYLENPPDPAYPNPVADRNPATGNPLINGGAGAANDQNPTSDVHMRRALAYLVDRDAIIADPSIGEGFGYPLYTVVPPSNAKYYLNVVGDPTIPWIWKYDEAAAVAELNDNKFPVNLGTGWRYWDRNGNSVEEADEYIELIFYIRSDQPGRTAIGNVMTAKIEDILKVRVNPQYARSPICSNQVMALKDFHLYTGGWSLSINPVDFILWAWDYYWHPGKPYNYGGHNDPIFNAAADGVRYANSQDEAVNQAHIAQYQQALNVLGLPIYCVAGNKAYRRNYSGPETPYSGNAWQGVVNKQGYGIDNTDSWRNMHPSGYAYDQGDPANPMTIRYGFGAAELADPNPIFASWLFDWNFLNQIYGESSTVRNSSDLGQFLPNLCKNFEVSTYVNPIYGVCSKIKFTLRPDVSWSDGYALTVSDVYFTVVELPQILRGRGLPRVWWYSNIQDILSFSILDPYTFEVLFDVKSYWTLSWIGSNIILPKHIWKPIAESGDVEAPFADPNVISCSSYRFQSYVPTAYILLVANRPGRTVTTDRPGAVPVTAVNGYYRNYPLYVNIHLLNPDGTDFWSFKIPPQGAGPPYTTPVKFKVTLQNLIWADEYQVQPGPNLVVDKTVYLDGAVIGPTHELSIPEYPAQNEEVFDASVPKCMHNITVVVTVKQPGHDSWAFIFGTLRYTVFFWVTVREDIVGGAMIYYDGAIVHPLARPEIPVPDCKVDIKDVANAAKAFGSYPLHVRWNTAADINGDYKIDIKDIAAIAKKFGWA